MLDQTRAANDLAIYDDVADRWWSDEVRWVRTLKNLVPARLAHFDRLVDWRGMKVLDLGCAGGFMAEALHDRGGIVTGVDPAEKAIAAARAHAAATGREIDYAVGVGEALDLADGAVDAVVCVDVLEHVRDLPAVLSEAARVLRPGGWFLFDTINRNPVARFATVTMAEDLLGLLPKGAHDPEMFIRPDELRAGLERAGFEPGPVTGLGPRGITRRGDLLFGRWPGALVLYIGSARRRPAD